MRQIIVVAGVALICLIIFLKSQQKSRAERYVEPSPSIFKSSIGLILNPPASLSTSKAPATPQDATCESIRTLADGIHTQVNNLCKEGFLSIPQENPTEADIAAHEDLIKQLNLLKAQIDGIPTENRVCSYAYRPIINILDMLEPDYELENNIKNDMAKFLTEYFTKVLHLNQEVHGISNLCDMVSSGDDDQNGKKEYIMEKLLDMVKLVMEIGHLKQNSENNKTTAEDIRENRALLYKEYKSKIKNVVDNHSMNVMNQIKKLKFKSR